MTDEEDLQGLNQRTKLELKAGAREILDDLDKKGVRTWRDAQRYTAREINLKHRMYYAFRENGGVLTLVYATQGDGQVIMSIRKDDIEWETSAVIRINLEGLPVKYTEAERCECGRCLSGTRVQIAIGSSFEVTRKLLEELASMS